MAGRRFRLPRATATCSACGREAGARIPPASIRRLTQRRDSAETALLVDCRCGRGVALTVGDVLRALAQPAAEAA